MKPTKPPDYRIADITRELRIGRDTALALLQNGDLIGYRINGQWRVEPSEVASFKVRNAPVISVDRVTARAIARNRPPAPAPYIYKPGDKVV